MEEKERAPHVLILGAGVMQFPALRAAKRMGWRVSVADADDQAPGIPLADHFLHVDLADPEGMTAAAGALKAREGLSGVFTAGTDFSYTVARVSRELGLPGTDPEAALRASDKARMRAAFRAAGVPSPRFVMIEGGSGTGGSAEKKMKAEGFSFPVVVKPVDNMGARGVRRADSSGELEEALPAALADSRSGKAILEEFIPGAEYSLDAVVWDGEVTVCGFADRLIRFAPYFVEMGHTMPTEADWRIRERVEETFARAIAALGIRNGQAKGDIKWTGAEAVAGEVAARLSGGYMSGWTYPYATGVDLTAAALRQAVGLPPGDLAPRWDHVTAERAFISIPGTVEALEDFEAAEKCGAVRASFSRVEAGSRVRFPRNNVEKCGNFIAAAPERAEAVEAAEEACRRVFVRLKTGERSTFDFLFRGAAAWAPDAFPLSREANRRRLERMPSFQVGGDSGEGEVPPVHILTLPEEEESADWHGCGWKRALEELRYRCRTPLRFVSESEYAPGAAALVLGRTFWRAFIRGGIQGAVWTVETLSGELRRGEPSPEWEELL